MKRLQLEEDVYNYDTLLKTTNEDTDTIRFLGRAEMKLYIIQQFINQGVDESYIEFIKTLECKGDIE